MKRIVAVLPMRGVSERVPGKNLRSCGGRPLYHHIMDTLLATSRLSEVVVDTDAEAVERDVRRSFPQVRIVRRAPELCGGLTSMNAVLAGTLRHVQADLVLQTHSTNPLLRKQSIETALETLLASQEHDSLFSVTALYTRLWAGPGQPLNHNPRQLLRTQDLPPVFEENSCLYAFSPELLRRRESRIGECPLLFELNRREALDIDDLHDFEVADALLTRAARAA